MQKCTTVLRNPWAESFTKIFIFVLEFGILCFVVKPVPWRRLGSSTFGVWSALAQRGGKKPLAWGHHYRRDGVDTPGLADGLCLKLDGDLSTQRARKRETPSPKLVP